jgi:hypothetical protein
MSTTALQLLNSEIPQLEAIIGLNALPGTNLKAMVMQELEYLSNLSLTQHAISDCIPASVVAAVKSVLKKNLTLDPDAGLVYVKTRSVYVKDDKGKNVKAKVLEIQETAGGKISVARQSGRILDIKQPIIKYTSSNKVESVTIELLIPSAPEPRWESFVFNEIHFTRWKAASHKENSRGYEYLTQEEKVKKEKPDAAKCNYANALYTSFNTGIDPEFAATKAIRHSLKGNRLGTNPNERYARAIKTIDIPHIEIDINKDIVAAQEETGNVENIPFEEVDNTPSDINIPPASDL